MDEENKVVVAEDAKPEKVRFWKKPLVRKIAKYSLITLAAGGIGAICYYAGYKNGSKVALPENTGVAESLDTNIAE